MSDSHTTSVAEPASTAHRHATAPASEHARLGRRARRLAAISVTYNAVEAVVAIGAGAVAGSTALVAFGLDSVIEVSSGLVILWQFRQAIPAESERTALRLIAVSFFALAAYVVVDSARALLGSAEPDPSPAGIGLAIASVLVMPWLSWAQRRTGRALGSGTVVADSTQTLLCTYLSAVLLLGLVLNATLGWAWADPVAGLVIAGVAVREGLEAWRGENCCPPPATGAAHRDRTADRASSGPRIAATTAGGCTCSDGRSGRSGGRSDGCRQLVPFPSPHHHGSPPPDPDENGR